MNIGWSQFARDRHTPTSGHCYTSHSEQELIDIIYAHWHNRKPGIGETDLSRKVVVPITVTENKFFCTTAKVAPDLDGKLIAEVQQRQEGEDYFVSTYCTDNTKAEEAKYVSVVCYSAEALLENGGTRTTDCDWEIVCLIVSPAEEEPMSFLTMARNFLEKSGGTKSVYTAQEFAESIYYWSQKVRIKNG